MNPYHNPYETSLDGLGYDIEVGSQGDFNAGMYGAILGIILWPKNPSTGVLIGFSAGYFASKYGLMNVKTGA